MLTCDKNSQKLSKDKSNSKKWPLVYQSSHVYTESAEYTKPRKRRYLARPPSHVPGAGQWPQPVDPWAGLTVRVYMDVHASGSRSLPCAATLSFTYWWCLQLVLSVNDRHQIFHIFGPHSQTFCSPARTQNSKTTTLLPSAKCTRPLFRSNWLRRHGGRPSGWHDIVTCQRLVWRWFFKETVRDTDTATMKY